MNAALDDFANPAAVQMILKARSVLDKVAIPVEYRSAQTELAMVELMERGLMIWMDRSLVRRPALLCDVYRLTPAGQALCDASGIRRH